MSAASAPVTPLVTIAFFRVPPARVPAAVVRMGTDRGRLRRTPGLSFWKLLGTGDGRTFDLRDADLRTWGLLAVWSSIEAARSFTARSSVMGGWRRLAEEAWRADLEPIAATGQWSGVTPFGRPSGASRPADGPVAAITRARLSPRHAPTFWRAVPAVTAELHRQPGLRLALGIGEAPVGLQGTFSLWASARDLSTFAYRQPAHAAAVEATPRIGWYAEELFARFRVLDTAGAIFGRDPLADETR